MSLTSFFILGILNLQVTRHSLAVAEFTTSSNAVDHMTGQHLYAWGNGDTKALQRKFMTALHQTQKFNILKRESIDRLYKEMAYRRDKKPDSIKAFKRYLLTEASFLIEGELSLFRFSHKREKVPYSNRVEETYELHMLVDMSLTEIETASYVLVDQADIRLKSNPGESITELVERAKKTASEDLLGRLVDELFPIQIIKGGSKEVFLTLSKSPWFKAGQILDAYAQSEEVVIDPYTQEILGTEEEWIGRIKLLSIHPKYAKARVLKAEMGRIEKGALCRLPHGEDE
jgi:hypothetical protein